MGLKHCKLSYGSLEFPFLSLICKSLVLFGLKYMKSRVPLLPIPSQNRNRIIHHSIDSCFVMYLTKFPFFVGTQ